MRFELSPARAFAGSGSEKRVNGVYMYMGMQLKVLGAYHIERPLRTRFGGVDEDGEDDGFLNKLYGGNEKRALKR